jgi:GntR family transcriptional regulator, arabinose operon transcriptional repressor
MTGEVIASPILASKFEQMVEILRKAVDTGEYAVGDRFASENDLAQRHGISRNTVREAVSVLVQQGYLTRTQGKGTYVAKRPTRPMAAVAYAIFIHAHKHVYEAQTRALVRALQGHQALPVVFDVDDMRSREQTEEVLSRLIDQGIAGIILEDNVHEVLMDVCRQRAIAPPPVAVLNRPVPPAAQSVNVVTDFEYGTRLGTEHLISLGHRDILFVIHLNRALSPGKRPEQDAAEYGRIARGYTGAMADAGLAARQRFFFIAKEFAYDSGEREQMRAMLEGSDRPDAVFAYGDVRAKHVIDIAADAGLRVPDDLAVIGYWNTPWTDMARVALTSVSIREDDIAQIAVEKLMHQARGGADTEETVVVKPELVVRESCGARKSHAAR